MVKNRMFRSTLKQIFPLHCEVLPSAVLPQLRIETPVTGQVPVLPPADVKPAFNLVLRGGESRSLGVRLLIDIPGLYQFETNVLLKIQGVVDKTEVIVPPNQKDLAPIFERNWPTLLVEDAFGLLLRTPEEKVEPPAQIMVKDINTQAPDLHSIEFFLPPVETVQSPFLETRQETITVEELALFTPDIGVVDFSEIGFDDKPDVLNMFKMLTKAWIAGKDYDASGKTTQEKPETVEMPPKPQDLEMCIHGLKKAYCAICAEQEVEFSVPSQRKSTGGRGKRSRLTHRRSATSKPPIVNPFDLLLPFLYPPLDGNFSNRIILPPDKNLFDYQKEGVKFLGTHTTALLADEMGLGKSIQAIFALRLLVRKNKNTLPSIIVCPKSVVKDWEMKFREWAPELRVLVVSGSARYREALWNIPAYIYIVGYDSLLRDIGVVGNKKFNVAILDEIQNIKNPASKRSKAVKKLNTNYRWGLSATPLENKLEDLVSIFSFLKSDLLSRFDASNRQLVQRKIEPYFLRRRINDVRNEINLGDKIERLVWLELTANQRRSYDAELASVRNELRPIAQDWQRTKNRTNQQRISARRHVLASLSRLKQVCNFDPMTGESCKVDFLLEKLPDIIDGDEKVLIFSQYPQKSLQPLKKKLAQFSPDLFDGSLSQKERDERIQNFQNTDKTHILLMSVKAGGVGITLTRANHVYFLDQWWNPAVNMQATGRAFRIGQDKTVYVTAFCVANTVEERIREILLRKQILFDEVIDEQSTTVIDKISIEELFEIFDLVMFDVILEYPGKNIGRTIQLVSEILDIDYEKARKKISRYPATLAKGISKQAAEEIRKALSNLSDVRVNVRPSLTK